jgi:hypothetical protein
MLSAIRKAILTIAVVALALMANRIPASAQQAEAVKAGLVTEKTADSTPPAIKSGSERVSVEELILTIRRLEERVKELEAKADKPVASAAGPKSPVPANPTAAAATASAPVTEAPSAALKPTDDKSAVLSFFEKTEVSGFVDTYYGVNFNHPHNDAQLRNFDTKHNQFSLNLVELALEKKPTKDSPLGFRVDLNYGPATEIVHSFEPGGRDVFRNVEQAYLSFLTTSGWQFDFGKFVTPHGAEVIETKDNWNYSRGVLFALAIPYYHFGARATYPVNDKFTFAAYLVNGWNNVVDNNSGKTLGLQFLFKPTPKLTIVQNYMAGPEQFNNNGDWRQLSDTILTYNATDKFSLMANYDYGTERFGGDRIHWQGLALYAKGQLNDWFAVSPRFEWYDDPDGFTTGLDQTVKDFTFTTEQKINKGVITRFEYRRDFSDEPFFLRRGDRFVKAQSTFTFGIIYAFSSKSE